MGAEAGLSMRVAAPPVQHTQHTLHGQRCPAVPCPMSSGSGGGSSSHHPQVLQSARSYQAVTRQWPPQCRASLPSVLAREPNLMCRSGMSMQCHSCGCPVRCVSVWCAWGDTGGRPGRACPCCRCAGCLAGIFAWQRRGKRAVERLDSGRRPCVVCRGGGPLRSFGVRVCCSGV